MQERHKNRTLYFHELAQTSSKYFIPYIGRFKQLGDDSRILEIGCGDGGNLLPFAQMGCYTFGVDIAEGRIADARKFFDSCGAKGDFIASDVFLLKDNELMSIKETRTPIELFEQTLKDIGSLEVKDRTLWLINPHYETKFGLRPRQLPKWIAQLPYVRNFFTTSCFYILANDKD